MRASSRLDGSTKCSMAAFILCHPICQAQQWDPCSTDSTEPPTRDPTWERGAQTLKGPSVALTAPQRGEAWPKVWLKLGAQRVRTEKMGDAPTYRCAAKIPPRKLEKSYKGFKQRWPNRSRLGRATEPRERSEYLSQGLPHIKVYICMCSVFPHKRSSSEWRRVPSTTPHRTHVFKD